MQLLQNSAMIPWSYLIGRIAAIQYYGRLVNEKRINRFRIWSFVANLALGGF
jgi:hypothetical protein